MDRNRWLKTVTQFYNVCGASPIINHILFFCGHYSHFDKRTLIQMKCRNIQPFLLKAGDSINDQSNDNIPNEKLKSLYNVEKDELLLKYGTTTSLPHHMISILVEAWYAFKMSSGNIIRGSFAKTKLTPPQSSWLNNKYTGTWCLHPSIFWTQVWINQQYITPKTFTYLVTSNQDWWSYGFPPSKWYAKIIKEHYSPSYRVWRCEVMNSHPYSINE